MGTWYIPFAFATAAAADPDAKLYYNDYNIEYAGSKATAAVALIEMVQAAGARIDGVGLQGHFIVGSTPSEASLLAQINTYAAMGLEVAYTELDVRFSSLPPTTAGLAQQATDYGSVTSACLASSACVGITVWYVSSQPALEHHLGGVAALFISSSSSMFLLENQTHHSELVS